MYNHKSQNCLCICKFYLNISNYISSILLLVDSLNKLGQIKKVRQTNGIISFTSSPLDTLYTYLMKNYIFPFVFSLGRASMYIIWQYTIAEDGHRHICFNSISDPFFIHKTTYEKINTMMAVEEVYTLNVYMYIHTCTHIYIHNHIFYLWS